MRPPFHAHARSPLPAAATLLAAALCPPHAAGQDDAADPSPLRIVATVDNEGALEPCPTCGGAKGGIARRGGVFRTIAEGAPMLRVDAGNAFYGASGSGLPVAERALLVRAAYEALRYDAVNVSWRDFRQGLAGVETVLRDAGLPLVSANLRRAGDGELLAAPYVVRRLPDGRRVAMVGLTAEPSTRRVLPHVQRQLEGVRFDDPVDALRSVLPRALEEAPDGVVVLYYGPGATLRRVVEAVGDGPLLAVAAGGGEHGPGAVGDVPVLSPAGRGREVATAAVGPGASPASAPRLVQVTGESPRAPTVADLVDPRLRAGTAPPQRRRADVPRILTAGVAGAMYSEAANRSLRLAVTGYHLTPQLGGVDAPAGTLYLALDLRFENVLPADLIYGADYGEGGTVRDLGRRLFLRTRGDTVVRLADDWDLEDLQIVSGFELPRPGAVHEARAVFAVPRAVCEAAEPGGPPSLDDVSLHFYSQSFAAVDVPVAGARPAPSVPADGTGTVAVYELGVHGFELVEEFGASGRAAADRLFAVVDLRGRSLLTQDVDALALDAGAALDAKAALPLIADFPKAETTLGLLVDGEFLRPARWDLGTMAEPPVFFPDRPVGGVLVFEVPRRHDALALLCAFGDLNVGEGKGGPVEPLVFPLVGGARAATPRPVADPLASLGDAVRLDVVSTAFVDGFAGSTPPAGRRYLKLHLRATNTTADSGAWLPYERVTVGGAAPAPASAEGPLAPPRQLFLPPGATRGFELVFEVPSAGPVPELAVSTVRSGIRNARLETTVGDDAGAGRSAAAGEDGTAAGTTDDRPAGTPAEPRRWTRPTTEPRGLEGVGLTGREVNEAIERGRDWLWAHLRAESGGELERLPSSRDDTLALLALVHTGLHREDPAFDAVVRRYLEEGPRSRTSTYEAAVFAMTVDAYGDPGTFHWLHPVADSFVRGQHGDGSWGYRIPEIVGTDEGPDDGPRHGESDGGEPVFEVVTEGEFEALDAQPEDGREERAGDNSTSQFAVLGLRAAVRRGVPVPARTWERALACFGSRQLEDGSWSYRIGGSGYGSMTCAGITALLLARWATGEEPVTDSPRLLPAIDWIDEHFDPDANPHRRGHHDYYALYSFERVGRLLDTEFLGRHEWYPLGARALVGKQEEPGNWRVKRELIVPTSFALLFLTRATEKLVEDEPTGPATLVTELVPAPQRDVYVVLDASGSMLARTGSGSRFEAARSILEDVVARLTEEQQIGLRVYGHRRAAIEPEADTDTELVVPMVAADERGRRRFLDALGALRQRGSTPLALSLEQAARDLARRGGRETTVLLLTDGGEDTRGGTDPVAAAEWLLGRRGVTLEVVGFEIGRPDWTAQLRGMAAPEGGRYWKADSASALTRAVRAAALGTTDRFVVRGADDEPVLRGRWGERAELPPGTYTVETRFAGESLSQQVRLAPGRTVRLRFDARRLRDRIAAGGGIVGATPAAPSTPRPEAADPGRPGPGNPAFCTNCGSKLLPRAKFCTGCGRRVPRR